MGAETRPERTAKTIRAMIAGDAARVSEILRDAPEAVFWPEASVPEVLTWQNTFAFVSAPEEAATVTGFLIGRQAADEAEILNLAVEKGSRRKGQGTALLMAAVKQLQARGVRRIFLEVRESNAAGIAFYKKHGFTNAGRRASYYRQPEEAALVMEKRLT